MDLATAIDRRDKALELLDHLDNLKLTAYSVPNRGSFNKPDRPAAMKEFLFWDRMVTQLQYGTNNLIDLRASNLIPGS